MYEQFATIAVFVVFAIGFVIANVAILSWLIRPKVPGPESKLAAYECGEPAVGEAWVRFDIRFYTTALVFLIFEVEVAFLFPWAAVYKTFRGHPDQVYVFLEVLLFIAILLVGFVYAWKKGDLDWVRSTQAQPAPGPLGARPTQGAPDGRATAVHAP